MSNRLSLIPGEPDLQGDQKLQRIADRLRHLLPGLKVRARTASLLDCLLAWRCLLSPCRQVFALGASAVAPQKKNCLAPSNTLQVDLFVQDYPMILDLPEFERALEVGVQGGGGTQSIPGWCMRA